MTGPRIAQVNVPRKGAGDQLAWRESRGMVAPGGRVAFEAERLALAQLRVDSNEAVRTGRADGDGDQRACAGRRTSRRLAPQGSQRARADATSIQRRTGATRPSVNGSPLPIRARTPSRCTRAARSSRTMSRPSAQTLRARLLLPAARHLVDARRAVLLSRGGRWRDLPRARRPRATVDRRRDQPRLLDRRHGRGGMRPGPAARGEGGAARHERAPARRLAGRDPRPRRDRDRSRAREHADLDPARDVSDRVVDRSAGRRARAVADPLGRRSRPSCSTGSRTSAAPARSAAVAARRDAAGARADAPAPDARGNATVSLDLEDPALAPAIDDSNLQQVLVNLLINASNAIAASGHGGTITIRARGLG